MGIFSSILVLAQQRAMINPSMKRVPPRAKKKKAKKAATTGSLRDKYKHLDLMTALMDSRIQDRQRDRKAGRIYQSELNTGLTGVRCRNLVSELSPKRSHCPAYRSPQ